MEENIGTCKNQLKFNAEEKINYSIENPEILLPSKISIEKLENQIKDIRDNLALLEIHSISLHQSIIQLKNQILVLVEIEQVSKISDQRKHLQNLQNLQSNFIEQERLTKLEDQIDEITQQEQQLRDRITLLKNQDVTQLFEGIQEIKRFTKIQNKRQQKIVIERIKYFQLLQKLNQSQIQDIAQLQQGIQERKAVIQDLQVRGQQNKINQRRKPFEKLDPFHPILKDLAQFRQNYFPEIQIQKEELEKELRNCLQDLEFINFCLLFDGIKEVKNQMESQEKRGLINKSLKMQEYIQKKEYTEEILIQLSNLNNSNKVCNFLKTNEESQTHQLERNNDILNYCNKVTSKIDLKILQKDISKIPECSEKFILQLTQMALQQKSPNQYLDNSQNQITDKTDILLNQFQILSDRLKTEDLISQEVNDILQKIGFNIKFENLEQIIQQCNKLLKKLRPISIQEMKRLIKKANKTAKLIEGQDILLFLGGTGSGKSTTIHFLAGSKMIEIKAQVTADKSMKYIGPDQKLIKSKALQKIKIGHQAESETKYITPVQVNFQDIGITANQGSIVLCDTPGFGDTAGPEVDIANGIGIVEAIKRCKSVRPVILISSQSIGDKGEGIRKLAHILVGFVNRISDKLSSFSYLFTKYYPNDNINSMLINIKNSFKNNQEECSDKSFVSIFDDMIEKTQDEVIRIDPLNDKPSKIIKQLIKMNPILNPEGVFQFSITESSKSAIQEQVRLHQLSILSAAKRNEYKLIEYKLDELKFLIDYLNLDFIKQAYSECINFIAEGLQKIQGDSISKFKRCIQNQNKLTFEDLREYKVLISQQQDSEYLRKTHFGNKFVQNFCLIQNLIEIIDTISQEFNQQSICSTQLKNYLDNLKLLADEFPEIKQKYIALCQTIETITSNIFSSCQEILITNDFSKLADVLQQVKQHLILFKGHLEEEHILLQQKQAGDYVMNYLYQICRVDPILIKDILEERDIDQLNLIVSFIESVKEAIELKEYIKMDEVKRVSDNLDQQILNYFEKINNKIHQAFKYDREKAFKDIEIQVQQMILIRKIKGLDRKTSENYQKIIDSIIGHMQQLRHDTELLLSNFFMQKDSFNLSKITRNLTGLKNGQWMNNIRRGIYDDIMKYLIEDIVIHSQKLHQSLLEIDLDLNHPENISIALNLVTEIERLLPFEQIISELTQYRDNALKSFKITIQNVFYYIQESFNLKNKAVYQQKLKQLEQIQQDYEEYYPEQLYLRGQGFQTIEQLNDDITQKQNEISNSNNQIVINSCQQSLKKLQDNTQNYLQLSTHKEGEILTMKEEKISNPQQSSQFLLEINGSNNSEIFEYIPLNYKKIERLEVSELKEKNNIEIQRLYQIQTEYLSIQRSIPVSQQGEEFLRSKGYSNIKNLEIEISLINKIIQNFDLKDQEYGLTKLDGCVAENSIIYIEACKGIKLLKSDANNAFLILNKFLINYGDIIKQEIQINYEKVIDATLKETSQVFSSAKRLAFFLQEICDLQKYQRFFELIKGKDIIQIWRTLLINYYIQLNDDMNQISIKKEDLKNKITIAKALSQTDFLIGDNKYLNLYKEFQSSLNNEFKEIQKRILKSVEKNDYKSVQADLLEIHEISINERVFLQIKNNIIDQIMDLIKEAKTKAILLGNNLDILAVQNIVDNLDKIECAKKYLAYFNFSDKQISNFEGILDESNLKIINLELKASQEIIVRKVSHYLEIIEQLIIVSDFYEAEVNREHVNQICDLLSSYCESSDLKLKIENLQDKIEEKVEELLEEYEIMEIEDYMLHPPKQILDKLQKASRINIKYSQFSNKMTQKIIENVRKILKEIKESTSDERNQHMLQRVEATLYLIPDELRFFLQIELENCKQLINQKEQGYKDYSNSPEISKDLIVFSKFMERCRQDYTCSQDCLLQNHILNEVQDYKEKVKESLSGESIQQTLNLTQKLSEYKSNFEKAISDIEYVIKEVQDKIVKRNEINLPNLQ